VRREFNREWTRINANYGENTNRRLTRIVWRSGERSDNIDISGKARVHEASAPAHV
jgi:hypothetical protein